MNPVYLTVPYKDKDIVKALGARWDGKNRRWFVAAGSDARFGRWMTGGEPSSGSVSSGASTASVPTERASSGTERVGASLSSLLFEASEAVRKALPVPRWILAEVASIRTHPHSKHTYLELVEHDDTGREMAKANARIWATGAKILRRFERETGGSVSEGMKLLMLAQADFSIQYGFGLTIEDIDTAWTLGEMQLKVLQIREKLLLEGLLDLNKRLRPAADFTRVAVVAPDGAAGLGDFMADAKLLIGAGLCAFRFFPAVFEGSAALGSVSAALAAAQELASQGAVDAVVVVRGGGAKTSLNWLNEYEMAALICTMGVPVMVGVGHERDQTILDEVACESFDTPSKVIGGIVSRVVSNAQAATLALTELRALAAQACSSAASDALSWRGVVESAARREVANGRAALDAALAEARRGAGSRLREARSSAESLVREVVGLGPSASLNRGYCVAQQGGETKGRIVRLNTAEPVILRMADGEVTLRIISKDD